ncbi:hypothetical protein C472_01242 [Halorubrum tebenquichense DSM 14210]|uniref:Uncharacterized protein n=1 Tax=Halorubrum tebenquichense DSM 14210 TaxID=1227485 RepID=M0E3B1_9EURY|nr:hypothetical protein C472_01242 [Halorubrum tebenquichense DSM 14210]
MICPSNLIMYPTDLLDMYRFVQFLLSVVLGLFVGFSVAFIPTPDPTGLLPIVVGLILTLALTAVFYIGIDKAASSRT